MRPQRRFDAARAAVEGAMSDYIAALRGSQTGFERRRTEPSAT